MGTSEKFREGADSAFEELPENLEDSTDWKPEELGRGSTHPVTRGCCREATSMKKSCTV